MRRSVTVLILVVIVSVVCALTRRAASAVVQEKASHEERPFDPALEEFVRGFKGAGEGVEGAGDLQPLSPQESLKHFQLPDGLVLEVVASEPVIRQPLNLHFDERGRLWVVQYLQYPFSAGLKVLKYDRYLRAVYDKVPPAPPNHVRGADKISILEDTDGDGVFDSHKDFVTGLNIASSVAVGRGGVWVLNPPYLLFYPDPNRDDVPDGDPEVHLSGFGLEDTHSIANSLHWGPDGWLYGATGSTSTSEVKGIKFLGQAIWRYHPKTREFELFAEGGGNTWSLDFDAKGRAFSGTNTGGTRGLHYVQGGYYVKNWSKHGPLTNPFSFGFFPHMSHSGYQPRFAQTFLVYESGALPGYEGQIIAGMSLTNRVQASHLLEERSTFRTTDTEALVLTDNVWFRPVDVKEGPDGAVYIADWHDIRLSHLSPDDNWDKAHGRIYRLKTKEAKPSSPFDLAQLSSPELVGMLSHRNKWFREQAQRILADRRDASVIPALQDMVEGKRGQLALEALWAVNHSGGLDSAFALRQLGHPDPYVRCWTIRLLGDAKRVSPQIQDKLLELARTEEHVEVRSQLASTCKRLPAREALPILSRLLLRAEDADDPHIPLLLWWAIAEKAGDDPELLLTMLKDGRIWKTPIFARHVATRLGRRFTAERGDKNFYTFSNDYEGIYSGWKSNYTLESATRNLNTCLQLLNLAPDSPSRDQLIEGMEEGLDRYVLHSAPPALQNRVSILLQSQPPQPALVSLALRLGREDISDSALRLLDDEDTSEADWGMLIRSLADRRIASAVPVFLSLLRRTSSEDLQRHLLESLSRFDRPEIPQAIVQTYPRLAPHLKAAAQDVLAGHSSWAKFLESLPPADIQSNEMTGIDPAGRDRYNQACGYCHREHGEGIHKSLVQSRWVLGPEQVLVRIVLDGKQDREMLMPAFRDQLTDQQIASILSYIRQSWGNRAAPVHASTVSLVRSATAARDRAWREEELEQLVR